MSYAPFMNIENNVSLPYVRNASRRGIPYHWQPLGPFPKVVMASTLHRFPTKRRDIIMVVTRYLQGLQDEKQFDIPF